MASDDSMQKARQAWVIAEIDRMEPRPKVTEIAAKMGYGKSNVSETLNGKSAMSFNFYQTFCKAESEIMIRKHYDTEIEADEMSELRKVRVEW